MPVPSRVPRGMLVFAFLSLLGAARPGPGPAGAQTGDALPPISWTCPMHRELLEERPGLCPVCRMDLVETRVQEVWTCPLHPVIAERAEGACPICRRALVTALFEVSWSCEEHPNVLALEPGRCPVCQKTLVRREEAKPHQDHKPKHGGLFFMAPDNWHHLEGTYPEPGVFRVHLYDNYSRPLNAARFGGRAVLKEEHDPSTGTREILAFPLAPSPDGAYLEARVGPVPLPARVTAKIAFGPEARESRFDFVFPELTREPEQAAGAAPAAAFGGFRLAGDAIPERPEAIAAEIVRRDARVRQLLERGAFLEIYAPALEAKDLVLALEPHLDAAPADLRLAVTLAAKRLVRAAWMLDAAGDAGDRDQVMEAYGLFESAVQDVKRLYGIP